MMRRRLKIITAMALIGSMLLGGCGQSEQQEQTGSREDTVTETPAEKTDTKKALTVTSNPVFVSEGIRRIKVSAEGEDLYSIEYSPEEYENSYEYWKMEIPYENKSVVDTEAMLEVYDMLESLGYESQQIAEGTDTGLENPVAEIEIDFCQATREDRQAALGNSSEEEQTQTTYGAEPDSTCTLLIGNTDGEGKYYTALQADTDVVYLMDSTTIDALLSAEPFSMILKVGTLVAVDTVKQVDITMDQKDYQMRSEDGKYYFGDKETDESTYQGLYTELLSVLLDAELTDEPSSQESLLEMEFIRNSEEAPDVNIKYLPYDDTYCVLSQDGVEKFLVKLEDVMKLKETIKEQIK